MSPILTPRARQAARAATAPVRRLAAATPATRRAAAAARRERAARVIAGSGLLDLDWYQVQAGRSFASTLDAARHYVAAGRRADLSPHPLYEPQHHVPEDKRRRRMGTGPFAVFLHHARSPKARPHPLFDPPAYLEKVPAARRHRYGALGHFAEHASADSPLPLPSPLPDRSVTWGAYRSAARAALVRWADHQRLVTPARLTGTADVAASRALAAELAGLSEPVAEPGRPLVSVVTPVRNRPQQVLAAIASVSAQTLPDWELIVVDDGSTDATPAAVEEVARRDLRVRLLRVPPGGVCLARNAGLAQACGRYVAWLDSDNVWTPDHLRVMTTVMAARGWRAAYSTLEFWSKGRRHYRDFDGGVEYLAVGNHVDLNVLVTERSLLAEIGGFDESLRRAVDYDLVYRVAKHTELGYVPHVGAVYSDDAGDTERISVKELKTWNYVVRDRHVVDWPGLARAAAGRAPDRVSVVVACRDTWRRAWRTVTSVLDAAEPADDLEVVVVDSGSTRMPSVLLGVLSLLDPRVHVRRTPANYNTGGARNVGLAASTGALVVFLDPGAEVEPGWLAPLCAALGDETTLGAAPLLVERPGVLAAAGLAFPRLATLPVPFLAGHPVVDALRVGPEIAAPALPGSALAVRAADAIAVRGFDPLYVESLDDADLCLRLAERRSGHFAVVTAARVHARPGPLHDGTTGLANRRLFVERWGHRLRGGDDPWTTAGFDQVGGRPETAVVPGALALVEPVLAWRPSRGDGPPEPGGTLRWVVEVESAALPGEVGDRAHRLAAALGRLGQAAVVLDRSARGRASEYLDDVLVVVHGATAPQPLPGRTAVLWLPPGTDDVTGRDLLGFEAVLTSAPEWVPADAPVGTEVVRLALDPDAEDQAARELLDLVRRLRKGT